MLKNMIRIGRVSSINPIKGTVRVIIEDQQNMVTDDLPLFSDEYYMPKSGDRVLCLFLGNGLSKGFCLGRYYYPGNPPPVSDPNIYYKDFFGEACFKYDQATKTLTIQADNVVIDGDLNVTGNITATGTVHGSNI